MHNTTKLMVLSVSTVSCVGENQVLYG